MSFTLSFGEIPSSGDQGQIRCYQSQAEP